MQVYADNAATTKLCPAALEAMLPCFTEVYGNPSSLHSLGQAAADRLSGARADIAACLGCQPDEIYFTAGGSEADNQAILTAARLGAEQGKKHIVSTAFEHPAVLRTLDMLKAGGYEITLLDVREHHTVTAAQVRAAIRPDTCLVTTMYANNEIGSVLPIDRIGQVCRQAGVLFHTDAVQAVGHVPIHVRNQNIDMLSLSAHKFHGPRGVGVLYSRIPPMQLIRGGSQERGARAGTENLPGICGLAAALKEACDHMEEHTAKITALRDRLIAGLSAIDGASLNGDPVHRLPGNVSFCFEGVEAQALGLLLDLKGICVSAGSACASGNPAPSHVLLAIGRTPEQARSGLRVSLGRYNTSEDVDYLLSQIPQAVRYLQDRAPTRKASL